YCASQHQSHHGFCDHASGRHSAHIGTLMNAGGSLARCHIYGLECSWNGGNWLHCRANTQLLTIGHAAFETTRAVSETIDTVFRTDHLIMRLRAWATSFLKAIADFNALDGLDTHQCSSQLCIQAVIARNVRAKADW